MAACNDLAFVGDPGGRMFAALCEGCGNHWFVTGGVRVHADNGVLFGCPECAEIS